MMTSLPNLHDATLKSVNFGWEAAVVHLSFKIGVAASDVAVVQAEGVTSLKCSRLLPWGPSSSVNTTALEVLVWCLRNAFTASHQTAAVRSRPLAHARGSVPWRGA